jgi:membrane protein implicated in regulation of membrane protease activity
MDYEVIIWFIVIILAALIEMNTMDLSSIWFSVGALLSFILAIAGAPLWVQLLVFILVSLILLSFVRPLAKKYLQSNIVHTNTDRLIGKVATCTKVIAVGDRGEVKIDGKYWMAVTPGKEDIDIDEKVEVLAVEGVKLVVDKIK